MRADRVAELWRYYQAGVANTLFGFGLYALFVRLGVDMYVAQIIAHFAGVAFNYLTYSRHVFRNQRPAKARFVASYALNYLVSLGTLALVAQALHSPYVAGAVATVIVSLINYFALRYLVFSRPVSQDAAR